MKYYVEKNLTNFEFWSGAKDRAEMLTYSQLEQLDGLIGNLLGEDVSDTDINDLFWFNFDTVCSLIGLWYNDDGDVVENKKEWANDIVTTHYPDIVDIYFDDFWSNAENEVGCTDDVLNHFRTYAEDSCFNHAEDVLSEKYPTYDELTVFDFANWKWDAFKSDEDNCEAFEKYADQQ